MYMKQKDLQSLFQLKPKTALFLDLIITNPGCSVTSLISESKLSKKSVYHHLNILVSQKLAYSEDSKWYPKPKDMLLQNAQIAVFDVNNAFKNLEKQVIADDKNMQIYSISKGYEAVVEHSKTLASIKKPQEYFAIGNTLNFESLIGVEIEAFWVQNRIKNHLFLHLFANNLEYVNKLQITDGANFRKTRFLEINTDNFLHVFEDKIIFWNLQKNLVYEYNEKFFITLIFSFLQELVW